MKNKYKTKFGIAYLGCLNCNFQHETFTGDFDIEIDAVTHAEEIHADNKKRCKNSRLIIEIRKYHQQTK